MGGAATSRERQAALRAGRRKDGLKYIHIWANPDQEQAIKAYLGDAQANPLHVTRDAFDDELDEEARLLNLDLQTRLADVQLREVQLAEAKARLAKLEATAENDFQTYRAWLASLDERQAIIQSREKELNALALDLKVAGARLKRDESTKKVSDKARTDTLVQRFTLERDYRSQTGEAFKPIVDTWTIKRRVQEISKLTSRTKTVRTSLATLAREFKDILGDRESDDLNDAGGVLLHISHAADIALKQARALEKRLKEEEKQRQEAAHKVATTYLQSLSDAEQVMHLCILDPRSYYELDKLLAGEAGYLGDVKRHASEAIVYKIQDALKAGQNREQALASLVSHLAVRMPQAIEIYGRRIEVGIAAEIAARLAKANRM